MHQSSIGSPMPGTGRGRYEPLSRLNLVERLLLLLLELLLLLLLLVKTPLVQSIPPCPSEGRVEIAIGRRRLPLDAAGDDASHARAGVVAGLGTGGGKSSRLSYCSI